MLPICSPGTSLLMVEQYFDGLPQSQNLLTNLTFFKLVFQGLNTF